MKYRILAILTVIPVMCYSFIHWIFTGEDLFVKYINWIERKQQ